MAEHSVRDRAGDGVSSDLPYALIVSDMYFQAAGLVQQLEALGWRAAVVPRTQDLSDRCRRSQIDLVVLDADLGLPAVTGLAQSIRARIPRCAVWALTGWWDARADDLRAITDTVVCKPPHPEQIREALGRWGQHGPESPQAQALTPARRLNSA